MRFDMTKEMEKISKKSALAMAIKYFLKHYDGLTVFLSDGRVEIDNNLIENQMRPIALLRKNCCFVASEDGGRAWAVFGSLIATCRLNGIDPRIYLMWVLEHIDRKHPWSRMHELLPWHCHHGRHGLLMKEDPEPWDKAKRTPKGKAA